MIFFSSRWAFKIHATWHCLGEWNEDWFNLRYAATPVLFLHSVYYCLYRSFVHPDKLADLFELVSKQLRFHKNAEMEDEACKHESITLPCIQCPTQSSSDNIATNPPMFMHVTLLRDSDPSKSCFHCILTGKSYTVWVPLHITLLLHLMFTLLARWTWNGRKNRLYQCRYARSNVLQNKTMITAFFWWRILFLLLKTNS